MPTGETQRLGNGIDSTGPSILPRIASFAIFYSTSLRGLAGGCKILCLMINSTTSSMKWTTTTKFKPLNSYSLSTLNEYELKCKTDCKEYAYWQGYTIENQSYFDKIDNLFEIRVPHSWNMCVKRVWTCKNPYLMQSSCQLTLVVYWWTDPTVTVTHPLKSQFRAVEFLGFFERNDLSLNRPIITTVNF